MDEPLCQICGHLKKAHTYLDTGGILNTKFCVACFNDPKKYFHKFVLKFEHERPPIYD